VGQGQPTRQTLTVGVRARGSSRYCFVISLPVGWTARQASCRDSRSRALMCLRGERDLPLGSRRGRDCAHW
jgi:hypothetical protein